MVRDPPSPQGSHDADSAIRAIIRWLVEEYGRYLNVPSWDDEGFLAKFTKTCRLSGQAVPRNTVRNLLNGQTRVPRPNTCTKLAGFFKPVIPHIEPSWFEASSLEQFQTLVHAQPSDRQFVTITVPKNTDFDAGWLSRWLCGVYVCYRFSFERSRERKVAREILHITGIDQFQFRMSFLIGGGDSDGETVEVFDGIVLPIRRSVFFAGWEPHRSRSLHMRLDTADDWRHCRFAILSSTRRQYPYYPVAACTVLIKMNHMPDDIGQFMKDATKIRHFNTMIEADFGKPALAPMELFLYNSSHRVNEAGVFYEESTFRLHEERFCGMMPDLHNDALLHAFPPFKKGWTLKKENELISAREKMPVQASNRSIKR